MKLRVLRCSSLDQLHACAPSILMEDAVRISISGEESEFGKAVHHLLALFVEEKDLDFKSTAERYGVEVDELKEMTDQGIRTWEQVQEYFEGVQTEVKLQSTEFEVGGQKYQFVGTGDVISPKGSTDAIFLDWKTGRIDDGYHNQMSGYAFNLWEMMGRPEKTKITGIVAFLRYGYVRIVHYSADDLREWEHETKHNILGAPETFHPGEPQCRHCTAYASCHARRAIVSSSVYGLALPETLPADDPTRGYIATAIELLQTLTTESKSDPAVGEIISDLLFRAKLVEQHVGRVRDLVREAVRRVGNIPLSGGLSLSIKTTNVRALDATKAMPVLRKHMADKEVLEAMKLSLPSLTTAYSKRFARGKKKAAIEQLEKALVDAGAIYTKPREQLEEVEDVPALQEVQNGSGNPTGDNLQPEP